MSIRQSAEEPLWLLHARTWIGIAEQSGPGSNPAVVGFYQDAGHPEVGSDSVAWCAAFVGACLKRSGVVPTGSLQARSYLAWGRPLKVPKVGAVVVLSRGASPSLGHVGFLIEVAGDSVRVLGGNQDNRVSIARFARSRVLGYRWPETVPPLGDDGHFPNALAHVLSLEGGFVDDPADPGGPTKAGITLGTLADHLGQPLDDQTKAELRCRLVALSQAEIAAIYHERYWRRADCSLLPPPLALMHFDAAVNHGPARAIPMLQASVGATVDGELGPETLGRCRAIDLVLAVGAYALERRTAYRQLATFPRFGRGWLARVEKTKAAALALANQPSPSTIPRNKEQTTMQSKPNVQKTKWWGESITLWGVLVTALTAVLPALGPLAGLEVSAELAQAIGKELTHIVEGGGGLIGTAIAIYGRLRARGPLIRKRLSLTL